MTEEQQIQIKKFLTAVKALHATICKESSEFTTQVIKASLTLNKEELDTLATLITAVAIYNSLYSGAFND